MECIYKHLGDEMEIDIVGKSKGGVYGRVLVDDWPGYVEDWLAHRPRGLAIMPAHPYNEDFKHPNVIRYLTRDARSNRLVGAALKAAFHRKEGQHWKELVDKMNPYHKLDAL